MCPGNPGNYAQFSARHRGPKRSNSLTGQAPRTPDSPLTAHASAARRHSDSETQSCHSLPYSLGDSRESLKHGESSKSIAACAGSAQQASASAPAGAQVQQAQAAQQQPMASTSISAVSVNSGRIQVK